MLSERDRYRAWYGGIAGASFVVITQLVTRDTFNVPHQVAIIAFAITSPLAAMFAVWPARYPMGAQPIPVRNAMRTLAAITTLIFCVGVGAVFWSFNQIAGITYTGTTFLALLIAGSVARATEKRNSSAERSLPSRGDTLGSDDVGIGSAGDPSRPPPPNT